MSEHEESTALGAYVLGACDPVEATLIEAHVLVCQRCRTEVDDLRPVADWLRRSAGEVIDGG